MLKHDESHTVELPAITTYHTAIRAVEAATTDIIDGRFRLSMLPRFKRNCSKEVLREEEVDARARARARQKAASATYYCKLPPHAGVFSCFCCGLIAGLIIGYVYTYVYVWSGLHSTYHK
jgi:hypothetical protein